MYICVTHVDARTGVPMNKEPMRNGPKFPDVKGFQAEWWDESNWPLQHPDQVARFYGTCDDDADVDIPGVIRVFEDNETATAQEQYEALKAIEMKRRLPSIVSARQLRLALNDMNLTSTLAAAFETLDENTRNKILIEWEYQTEFNKYSNFVQKVAELLNLTEDQLDDIFVTAAGIGDIDIE